MKKVKDGEKYVWNDVIPAEGSGLVPTAYLLKDHVIVSSSERLADELYETIRSGKDTNLWPEGEISELMDKETHQAGVLRMNTVIRLAVELILSPKLADAADTEDEDLSPPPLVATLPPETLAAIEVGLTSFFDHLTPPEKGTYRQYTWWLQIAIIGYFPEMESEEDEIVESVPTLDLLGCCKENTFAQRDMEALGIVMQALRRLLKAAESTASEEEIQRESMEA